MRQSKFELEFIDYIYNRIRVLDNNTYIEQKCTGIEPTFLASDAGQKLGELAIRPERHISNQNNEKFIRSNFITNGKKIMNES